MTIETTTNASGETIWINESGREFVFLGSVCQPEDFGNPCVCDTIAAHKAAFTKAGIEILDKEDTGWYCQYNFITWWNQDGYAMIFAGREVLESVAHHKTMETDKTYVAPFATIEEMENATGDRADMFRKFWYHSPATQSHHATDKWVWKVLTQATECVEARDYHKLFKVCRAASIKASCDEAIDAIAHIWDAMATAMFLIGVDTNHPYNLAED